MHRKIFKNTKNFKKARNIVIKSKYGVEIQKKRWLEKTKKSNVYNV